MKDESKSIPNKNNFKIPGHIIRTGKLLQFFSTAAATRFALKIFKTPPKYSTPEREEMMRESAKRMLFTVPSLQQDIMVYEYGYSKQKVLLIHGWAGRGTQLYQIADKILENRMMVISFDAPAHGLSYGKTTTFPEYLAAIHYLNDKYGPFEAVIGHSFGGVTAMAALAENPFAKKLVIIGVDYSVNDVIDNFVKKLQLKPSVSTKMKKEISALFKTSIASVSPGETAKQITIPTLVLHDSQDMDVDVSNAYKIRQNLANGQLIITKELGHRRILRDKKLIDRIIDFIRK